MNISLRDTLTTSVARVLTPLVRLMLMAGLSWNEFLNIAKSVFVEVASEDYGLRGRPTNISRVAAMTGLSRKEVSRIRDDAMVTRWTPSMERSPANMIMHHWHHDPEFCVAPGEPRNLEYDACDGFVALVKRYAGDIPPGAMRAELIRTGAVVELQDKSLKAVKLFTYPSQLYDDFIRNIAFTWTNLGNTLVYNVSLLNADRSDAEQVLSSKSRFERSAWTEHLLPSELDRFRQWVRDEGSVFIERADHWIGQRESPPSVWKDGSKKTVGVGLYYFEEE